MYDTEYLGHFVDCRHADTDHQGGCSRAKLLVPLSRLVTVIRFGSIEPILTEVVEVGVAKNCDAGEMDSAVTR